MTEKSDIGRPVPPHVSGGGQVVPTAPDCSPRTGRETVALFNEEGSRCRRRAVWDAVREVLHELVEDANVERAFRRIQELMAAGFFIDDASRSRAERLVSELTRLGDEMEHPDAAAPLSA